MQRVCWVVASFTVQSRPLAIRGDFVQHPLDVALAIIHANIPNQSDVGETVELGDFTAVSMVGLGVVALTRP